MILRFLVPGDIKAKGRHHTVALKRCSCGKTTTAYQCPGCGNTSLVFLSNVKLADGPTEKYESFVSLCAMNAGVAQKGYTGAVRLNATFRFQVPPSRVKKLKEGDPHTQRPDLDNCQKSLLDGLNRVAWHDDSQVVEMRVAKKWTKGEPGVEVEIQYMDLQQLPIAAIAEAKAEATGAGGDRELLNPSPFQSSSETK